MWAFHYIFSFLFLLNLKKFYLCNTVSNGTDTTHQNCACPLYSNILISFPASVEVASPPSLHVLDKHWYNLQSHLWDHFTFYGLVQTENIFFLNIILKVFCGIVKWWDAFSSNKASCSFTLITIPLQEPSHWFFVFHDYLEAGAPVALCCT